MKLSQDESNMSLCSCRMKQAVFYCPLHDDLICSGCNTRDHTGCEANSITAVARWNRSEDDIDTKEAENKLLKKKLRKLDFEREKDVEKLHLSRESSERNVTFFVSDLHKLIDDQNELISKEISHREIEQNMYISGCREMCMLLNQHLDSKMQILQNTKGTKDDFNSFVINFRIAKFLSGAKTIINKMETAYIRIQLSLREMKI